jgi:hypothetical protein
MKKPNKPTGPAPYQNSPAASGTGRAGMSPKKKASFWWLIGLLVTAFGVFVCIVPASHRIRVVVAFAIVAPWAIGTFFYVMRNE